MTHSIANIDANECIKCARCIPVCPVDALSGDYGALPELDIPSCIGCDLCMEECPVDCITLIPAPAQIPRSKKDLSERHKKKITRIKQREHDLDTMITNTDFTEVLTTIAETGTTKTSDD